MWEHHIQQTEDGIWLASSIADLDDVRRIKIQTHRRAPGMIVTFAAVFTIEDGIPTHRLAGDFAETVSTVKWTGTRVNIQRIHNNVMDERAGEIISRAIEFYRKG